MAGRHLKTPFTGTNAAHDINCVTPVRPSACITSRGLVAVFLVVSFLSNRVRAGEPTPGLEAHSATETILRVLRDIENLAPGQEHERPRAKRTADGKTPIAGGGGQQFPGADLADDWLKAELTYISTLRVPKTRTGPRVAHHAASLRLQKRRQVEHILASLERLVETNHPPNRHPVSKRRIRRALIRVLHATCDPSLRNRAVLLWLAFRLPPPNDAEARIAPELMALYDKRHPFVAQPPRKPRWHFSMELFGSFAWLGMDSRKVLPGFSLWLPGMRLAWRWKRIAAHLSIQSQSISYVSAQFGVRFYSFRNSRFRISHAIGLGATLGAFFDVDDDDGLFVAPWATASLVEAWVRIYKGLWLHVSPIRVQSFLLGAGFLTFDFGLLWEF